MEENRIDFLFVLRRVRRRGSGGSTFWIERSAYRQFSVNRFNHFLTKLALLEFVILELTYQTLSSASHYVAHSLNGERNLQKVDIRLQPTVFVALPINSVRLNYPLDRGGGW